MPTVLHIRLLGQFRAMVEGPVLLPTRKTGLLLVYLAMHAGKAIPRDRLKTLLWSDRGDQQASGSLRRALADLRKQLGHAPDAFLDATATTVALRTEAVEVDALRFEHLSDAPDEAEWAAAAALYQDDLIAGTTAPDPMFEDWLRVERERLRVVAVALAERLAGAATTHAALDAATDLARRLLRADPVCEEAHRALIVGLRKQGRTNAATKQYAICVEALRTVLGVEPEASTRALLDTPALAAVPAVADATGAGEIATTKPAPVPVDAPQPPAGGAAPVVPTIKLIASIVGSDRLAVADAAGRRATLETYHPTIADLVDEHGGRIVDATVDRLDAEFERATLSVRAAVAIQRAVHRRNADLEADRRVHFHIGVHLNDIGAALAGDAVTVAARLREVDLPTGICISGSVRDRIEGKLDFPLAVHELYLESVGHPVPVHCVDWRDPPDAPEEAGGRMTLPDKPSIAVLPFLNLSGDPEQEFFADGLTEDVITALSSYRWFFVIARNSSFAFKGRRLQVGEVARELGVRYVVEGSVRTAGDRIRVTGQLVECETGTTLWAKKFDRAATDLFAIQDELARSVVGAIEPEILLGESNRALRRPTTNLDAYGSCMRGIWHHHQATAAHIEEAIRWYRRALALDPGFSRAHMWLARALYRRCVSGYSDDLARDRDDLIAAAERALALDERDPDCHFVMFLAHLIALRHDAALAAAQRVIDLNPNNALGHAALGRARTLVGRFAESLEPLHTAMRLSPHDPIAYYFLSFLGLAHYHLGAYETAMRYCRRALAMRRMTYMAIILAACLGRLGRTEEAAALVAEMSPAEVTDAPEYFWDVMFPYADPAHREDLMDGLRKAGLAV